MDDRAAMEVALALAERARGRVRPNPPVGCVLVRDGAVVGQGWTQPPPGDHAEAMALAAAGPAARGATAYVTLEPCDHHGRTPPCARALAGAGVARVVYAVADPHDPAAGGAASLRRAGVTAEQDHLAAAFAADQLAAHLHAARTGRPLVVVKLAASLDGRIAAADGTSQWLTGHGARARAHRLRAEADAVAVGVGTALADDPRLTVRLPDHHAPNPLRVVLDGSARTPPGSALADVAAAPTLVWARRDADPARLAALRDHGVEVVTTDADRTGGADLRALLAALWDRDVRSLLVEGGARVTGAFLAAGLADRVVVHLAPALLGAEGLPALRGLAVPTLAAAPRLHLAHVEADGDDVVATYTTEPSREVADAPEPQPALAEQER